MTDTGSRKVRPTTLVVDLKALKEPWAEWCTARDLTPSEAVRRVLASVMRGNPTAEVAPHPADFRDAAGDEVRRVEIRLSPADYLAMSAAADREGLSLPRWLAALVRVHLAGAEPLGQAEVEALARSNQLLLALGRNINQIAYNMNQRVDKDELTLDQIAFLSHFLKEHTEVVSAVLHANSKRWRR